MLVLIGKNYVIHTVGPIWRGGNKNEDELLYQSILNALRLANKLDQKSISIPAISTGIFGYPLERACKKITEATKDYIDNDDNQIVNSII